MEQVKEQEKIDKYQVLAMEVVESENKNDSNSCMCSRNSTHRPRAKT